MKKRKPVSPRPITGKESTGDLVREQFHAFAGRNVREAYRLMRKSVDEDYFVFLTFSGAMTPAGIHHAAIIPLIEAGAVNAITTTGANLYHDIHRSLGFQIDEIDPHRSDLAYREEEIIRIYDLGFSMDVLLETDKFVAKLLCAEPFQRAMTTPELHHEIGRAMAQLEEARRIEPPSLLATCFRHDIPIFCGAPQDGSLFLGVLYLQKTQKDFRFSIDIARDVRQMAAIQLLTQRQGNTAVWILGGGVPKNYTLQGEPTLSQILGLEARGFDLDLQICVDVADNGALSSCTAGEGHTWGKTSAECVERYSVYLRADVTTVLPVLTHALLAETRKPRPPKRLFSRLAEAEELLDRELDGVLKRSEPLVEKRR